MAAVARITPPGAERRVFLMLQGPHGPFFDRLGQLLTDAGAEVWRVGFNAGDEFFWSDRARFIPHQGGPDSWPAHLERLIAEKRVTDIVLYGDVRPIHAAARQAAARHGLVLEVAFEGLNRSTRHRSGVAMRFPRISRLRWDKPPGEADRIETLNALLDDPPADARTTARVRS